MSNELTVTNELALDMLPTNPFSDLMETAKQWSMSTMIPANYVRRPENCVVALDMASRMGVSPMFVMQNLYVVQGRPSWSGTAVASLINNSPRYSDVELVYVGEEGKDTWGAYVTATSKRTGKTVKGATVTIGIAKAEGWLSKNGSKWKTMPELMLSYRAYSWFGRQYCPELMMGLQSTEEVEDVSRTPVDCGTSTPPLNPYEVVK